MQAGWTPEDADIFTSLWGKGPGTRSCAVKGLSLLVANKHDLIPPVPTVSPSGSHLQSSGGRPPGEGLSGGSTPGGRSAPPAAPSPASNGGDQGLAPPVNPVWSVAGGWDVAGAASSSFSDLKVGRAAAVINI